LREEPGAALWRCAPFRAHEMTPSDHPGPRLCAPACGAAAVAPRVLHGVYLGGADVGAGRRMQQRHDRIVERLRLLKAKEGSFGAAYRPLYHAALPWYEAWGGANRDAVDTWMSAPEDYAEGLADAMEHGRNFFADNPASLLPIVYDGKSSDGHALRTKFWIKLPAGFPGNGAPSRSSSTCTAPDGSATRSRTSTGTSPRVRSST